jgi:phosphatidylserine decarboxylase
VIATGALAFFFRDPVRVVPVRDNLVVAPADGVLIGVDTVTPPAELGLGSDPMTRASVFLSLLDVHVNRAPMSGRIESSIYQPGVHHNAAMDSASRENERHSFVIASNSGLRLGVVLISGAVARRIVTEVKTGDVVGAGERIGLIRFGSRVDLYLPSAPAIMVSEGQRIFAGETVIADFDSHEPARTFRKI